MNKNVAKVKDGATNALAIVAGLVAGKFAMEFAGSKIPQKYTPLLGLLGFAPYFTDMGGELGKNVGHGLIAAGTIQGVKNFTAGKTGILASVNNALPALSGFSGYAGLAGLHEDVDYQLLAGVGGAEVMASDLTLMM